jgi:hypothetical protein
MELSRTTSTPQAPPGQLVCDHRERTRGEVENYWRQVLDTNPQMEAIAAIPHEIANTGKKLEASIAMLKSRILASTTVNTDLSNALQRQEQTLQLLSNIQKLLTDTARPLRDRWGVGSPRASPATVAAASAGRDESQQPPKVLLQLDRLAQRAGPVRQFISARSCSTWAMTARHATGSRADGRQSR